MHHLIIAVEVIIWMYLFDDVNALLNTKELFYSSLDLNVISVKCFELCTIQYFDIFIGLWCASIIKRRKDICKPFVLVRRIQKNVWLTELTAWSHQLLEELKFLNFTHEKDDHKYCYSVCILYFIISFADFSAKQWIYQSKQVESNKNTKYFPLLGTWNGSRDCASVLLI